MPGFSELLLDYALPAIIVGVVLGIGWFTRGMPRDGRWAGGIALAAGFAAAQAAIAGVPNRAPWNADAGSWLFWFTVPVAILGLLDWIFRPSNGWRAFVLLLFAGFGVNSLLAPLIMQADFAGVVKMHWLLDWPLAISLIVLQWWLALETLAERMPGFLTPAVFTIVAAGATAVFGISANVQATQSCTALTVMCAVATIAAWPIRNLSLARGAVLGFVVPLIGEMTFVHFYSYTPPPLTACGLLLIAPLLSWAGELPRARQWGRRRIVIRLAPVLVAVALAALITARAASNATHSGGHSHSDPAED